MALIKSISGIRGTIGGGTNDNLTPVDIVKFSAAYGTWLLQQSKKEKKPKKVVIGRDGRISGLMVKNIVTATLVGLGIDVIDTDLSTTPTVEMAVVQLKADGGIILTASHNPKEWNALKLLNNKGEFISSQDGQQILQLAQNEAFDFANVLNLGKYETDTTSIDNHIAAILKYKLVDTKAITAANFKIVIDVVNSTGALALPPLLKALGVKDIVVLNGDI
ncbi:MAG: phosphoglucosamine mutase, partial [Bacteroidetes bacterium]|nr:phosphoglucosamine mutase [Bacteroidota bacterium]